VVDSFVGLNILNDDPTPVIHMAQ